MPSTLTKQDLEDILHDIETLSAEEREYIKAVFGKYLSSGVSKWEAEQALKQLRINSKDSLDSAEVARVQEKVLTYFSA